MARRTFHPVRDVGTEPRGFQHFPAKFGNPGAELGLSPGRAAPRAGSARVAASQHITWPRRAFMAEGASCPMGMVTALVRLQQDHIQFSKTSTKPGLGPGRAAPRAGSARVAASQHITWPRQAFMAEGASCPMGTVSTAKLRSPLVAS